MYVYMYKKENKMYMFTYTKKEQNAYVYVFKIWSDMHSLTYTQKSCRHSAGSRDAYVYMRTLFRHTQTPTVRPAGRK